MDIVVRRYIYQSKEGPHVTSMDFNPRLKGDWGRKQLMAIEDLLIGVVSDPHFHCFREIIYNISYHSPSHKRVWHSCNVSKRERERDFLCKREIFFLLKFVRRIRSRKLCIYSAQKQHQCVRHAILLKKNSKRKKKLWTRVSTLYQTPVDMVWGFFKKFTKHWEQFLKIFCILYHHANLIVNFFVTILIIYIIV